MCKDIYVPRVIRSFPSNSTYYPVVEHVPKYPLFFRTITIATDSATSQGYQFKIQLPDILAWLPRIEGESQLHPAPAIVNMLIFEPFTIYAKRLSGSLTEKHMLNFYFEVRKEMGLISGG